MIQSLCFNLKMEHVHKIIIVTNVDIYNEDTIHLKLTFLDGKTTFLLSKVTTNGQYNIYSVHCSFKYKYMQFKINNDMFSCGSLNEDDVGYNHCAQLWTNELTKAQEHEKTASVYYFGGGVYQTAITIYFSQLGG